MPKVIARFAGVVTFDDESTEQFAAHLDDQGNIAVNDNEESLVSLQDLQGDQTWLQAMLALISSTLTLTTGGGRSKTVTDLHAELSGRVALDDNTWGDFIVQYNTFVGAHVPSGGDVTNWQTAVGADVGLAELTAMFEALVGTGNVTI